jgi:hypothetical protein
MTHLFSDARIVRLDGVMVKHSLHKLGAPGSIPGRGLLFLIAINFKKSKCIENMHSMAVGVVLSERTTPYNRYS